ncbi:MAG: hypothetical protein AAFY41_14340 [Bacteroidota bacterium]
MTATTRGKIMIKTTLENKILEADEKLQMSENDLNWLTSSEFKNYMDAWIELQNFYLRNSGNVVLTVSSFVLRSYLRLTRKLNQILHNPQLLKYHAQVADTLDGFEYVMDSIIDKAFYELHYQEDEDENKL